MPSFVVNAGRDSVWARDWTPGSSVTLTIGDFSETQTANDYGEIDFNPGFDIVIGDFIEMSDGQTYKAHYTRNLGFTSYNLDEDTISGFSTRILGFDGGVFDGEEWWYQEVTVDSNGNWTMDFDGQVDLVPGISGYLDKWDEDGDATEVDWRVPRPLFVVNLNEDRVWCNGWSSNATLTLSI